MKTLNKEQVLRLHNALLETFGGTAGIRDDGLLESALNAPFATFGGQYLYPSVQAKAAQLGFGFVLVVRFVLPVRFIWEKFRSQRRIKLHFQFTSPRFLPYKSWLICAA